MMRLIWILSLVVPILAGPPWSAEIMPAFTTNRFYLTHHDAEWLMAAVSEPPLAGNHWREQALYVRAKNGSGDAFERIDLPRSTSDWFGLIGTIKDDVLIAKSQRHLYFFRRDNGKWTADGKIDGGVRETAEGSVSVQGNFLI